MNTDLVPDKKPTNTAIESIKLELKDSAIFNTTNSLLNEFMALAKIDKKDKKQEQRSNELLSDLACHFMLDNGILLMGIPKQPEKRQGLLSIRKRLIEEYNCTTAAELILVDEIAAAYWRLMKYENYTTKLVETEDGGYSINQLKINALKEARNLIEQAHRQIDVSLTMLKNLKQPQLKVNVKTDNAYFAQNQQIINEKPADEPPIETIKPK